MGSAAAAEPLGHMEPMVHSGRAGVLVLLMIEILHCPKDPKLWELWHIFLIIGDAGFISSTVGQHVI